MNLTYPGTAAISPFLIRPPRRIQENQSVYKIVEQQPTKNLSTILLVDDNIDTRILTKMFLNNFGYEVDSVESAESALSRFDPELHRLVLTDNSMPEMTGGEMAQVIKQRSPLTPILMCTGHPPNDCSASDMVIPKPTHLLAIKDAIAKLLEPGR